MSRRFLFGCLAAVLFVVPASAQMIVRQPHQLEIYNGLSRTVRYYPATKGSLSDRAALRDLERIENEVTDAGNLAQLGREYIANERILLPQRRQALQAVLGLAYPVAAPYGGYSSGLTGYGAGGYYPASFAYGGLGFTGVGMPYAAGAAIDPYLATQATTLGDPVLMAASIGVLARRAAPEYIETLHRDYERVLARAAASPTISAVAGVVPTKGKGNGIIPAGSERDAGLFTLTMKGGEKVRGYNMTEDRDWYVLDMPTGGKTRVRQSEVIRLDMPAAMKK